MRVTRRRFLETTAAATAGFLVCRKLTHANGESVPGPRASGPDRRSVLVVEGTHYHRILEAGIARLGGWKAFVKPGAKVVLKPNAHFTTPPEQRATTWPELVGLCVSGCRGAGAREVVAIDHPEWVPAKVFERNGIQAAVEKAGGIMRGLTFEDKEEQFERVVIPNGTQFSQKEHVAKDVLHCDCLINLPIPKPHPAVELSLSMKNWMGTVKGRRYWHQRDLHRCIAEFNTFIKAHLVIVDAMSVMGDKGPNGPCPPERMIHPRQLIFGTDPVAVDAYTATLFGKQPFDVGYVRLAHEMGVGCGDLTAIRVERITA